MRPIGLLGATGYTGRLVAAELVRAGLPHRIGARSPDRLATLTAALPCPPGLREEVIVDVTDRRRLAAFCAGLDALITTVGPFARLGRYALAAAVHAGVPYVDSTGEPEFLAEVYRDYSAAPVPVLPAAGFDYLPGDLAAAIAAADLPAQPRRIVVGYALQGFRPSRGTLRSALGAVGALGAQSAQGTSRPAGLRRVVLPFPDGQRIGLELPWGERQTVPRHLPGVDVVSALAVPELVATTVGVGEALARALPRGTGVEPMPTAPAAGVADRAWVGLGRGAAALERLAGLSRLPDGPGDRARQRVSYQVLALAEDGHAERRGVLVRGHDVYASTARLLVYAAHALAVAGAPTGALSPAQAVRPAEFLDAVAGELISWHRLPVER